MASQLRESSGWLRGASDSRSSNVVRAFAEVTEIADDNVSREQVERLCHRYYWAGSYCKDKDILEVACGTGQGLGYLASLAKRVVAGDIDIGLVAKGTAHYGDRIPIKVMDACALPFPERSLDVVLIFEALYYLSDADRFFIESRRVLRPGGRLLIVNANKDMDDFSPSALSVAYHGVRELNAICQRHGFECDLFGYWSYAQVSSLQKILKPVKRMAIRMGLMPRTMRGKKLLRRLVFGRLVAMPREIAAGQFSYAPPVPISGDHPDRLHRVIYCTATLR